MDGPSDCTDLIKKVPSSLIVSEPMDESEELAGFHVPTKLPEPELLLEEDEPEDELDDELEVVEDDLEDELLFLLHPASDRKTISASPKLAPDKSALFIDDLLDGFAKPAPTINIKGRRYFCVLSKNAFNLRERDG